MSEGDVNYNLTRQFVDGGLKPSKKAGWPVPTIAAVSAVIVASTVTFWLFRPAFVARGIARLGGADLLLSVKNLTLEGTGQDIKPITVTNLSNGNLSVLGYNATCSCVKISGLPITLGAGESFTLTARAVSESSNEVPVIFISEKGPDPTLRVNVTVRGSGSLH